MNTLFRLFRSGFLQPFLIVVAVALGVAVVTAVVAYISSSNAQQARLEADLSFREIRVMSGAGYTQSPEALPKRIGSVNSKPVVLTAADLEAVRVAAPSADYAYVHESHGGIAGDREYSFDPVTLDYLEAARVEVIEGSSLTPSDFREQRPVMLITREEAARAYLTGELVGRTISDPYDNRSYIIVGILPPTDPDDPLPVTAIMPYKPPPETNEFQVRADEVSSIWFAVEDVGKLDVARAEVEAYARKTWGDGVTVTSQRLTNVRERTRAATLFTAIFASLGLLIAAFNILNLFLARVLRLQRSIAIRRALGASRWTIRRGVLGEALGLGLLGGVSGIGAGYGLIAAFNAYVSRATEGEWPVIALSLPTALLGLGLALLLCLVFSFYPALVASSVSIRDALGEA